MRNWGKGPEEDDKDAQQSWRKRPIYDTCFSVRLPMPGLCIIDFGVLERGWGVRWCS